MRPRSGRSRDIIPAEVRTVIHRERERAGVSWEEIGRATGLGRREMDSRGGRKIGFRRF